jgi:hypothetical protein
MPSKRRIRAKDVVRDIRAGMSNAALMEKYQISERSLQRILSQMLDAGALMEIELVGRLPVSEPEQPASGATDTVGDVLRRSARSYVMVRLPVYDLDDLTVEGYVEDVSETGLMVGGIRAAVGETKSLLIQADEFADVFPFTFDVECRWSELQNDGSCVAGFEITSISQVGKRELEKLVRLLGLS